MFKIFRINHISEKKCQILSVFIQFKTQYNFTQFIKICIKHKQLRTRINIFNDHNIKKSKTNANPIHTH